jgi:hypothetical protein
LDEAEEVDEDKWEDLMEAFDVGDFTAGDFEFQHHDGDDDGDDAVGEGFEAGWGEVVHREGNREQGVAKQKQILYEDDRKKSKSKRRFPSGMTNQRKLKLD